jgi:ribosomal protein S1
MASTVKIGQKLEGSTVLTITKGGIFFDAGLSSDVLATTQMLSKNINDYTRGEVADLIVMQVQGERVSVSTKSEEEIGTPLASLVRGTSVTGKVVRVDSNVGIFLDIGAAKDALWRMKGLGASLPPKPLEEYVAGEEVTGLIITRVDTAAQTLEVSDPLSLAQAPAEETSMSMSNLKVGTKVSGTVSRVMEFGVFVNVGAERDALYPVSQLEKPSSAYKVGDKLDDLRVSEVDPEKRRLGVSMKKNASDYTVGEEVTGKVSKVMPFGLFVDIGASVDVLAPASMLEKSLDEYGQGDELTDLKIASVDVEKNKMSVGQGNSQKGGAGRLSIDDISVGQKLDGVVRMTREYGAFVDIGLGRRDALMPIAMMGDVGIDSFKPNDQIAVYVAQIDEENDRVTISFVEPTDEMKMRRGRVQGGKDDGGDYGIPAGFCLPDPKRFVGLTGREDLLDPEPISWREMNKKYPGVVSFPEKEYEVTMTFNSRGLSCSKEMTPASSAWIPIPLHLRKPDAGPPEIPIQTLEEIFPNNPYDTGISPEIHVKYRHPPLNDPNYRFRPTGLPELKPMPEEVMRARIPEYIPERKADASEEDAAPKKAAKKYGYIRADNIFAK